MTGKTMELIAFITMYTYLKESMNIMTIEMDNEEHGTCRDLKETLY